MKKIIALVISLMLILTSTMVTFAKNNASGNDNKVISASMNSHPNNGSKDNSKDKLVQESPNVENNAKGKGEELPNKGDEKIKDTQKPDEGKSIVEPGINNKDVGSKKIIETVHKSEYDILKEQLKQTHNDKANRKEILKKLMALRKKNKDKTIPIFINGEEFKSTPASVVKGNKTVVPVKAITKALGATVQFDPKTNVVTVTKAVYGQAQSVTQSVYGQAQTVTEAVYGQSQTVTQAVYGVSTIVIKITLGSNIATVNGKEVVMGTSPSSSNGTMVPLKFIAEALGMRFESDTDTGVVLVESPVNTPATINYQSNTSTTAMVDPIPKTTTSP